MCPRADDDFKAALNAKIMLGGMGGPGMGGPGMGRPRPGLDGGKAAYAAAAADELPQRSGSGHGGGGGAFMAELYKKVGKWGHT